MLYYSYDIYQARRLEMVRHSQLATVTVTDGAKHCVTGRQWSHEVRVHFRFMFISNNQGITSTDINIIQA